jgi:S-adenosylmethionine hydrolase
MARTYKGPVTTPAGARQVRSGMRPFVSLLTDFGLRDPSVGILHAVVLGIARDAAIVDISHEVSKFAVRDGALLLWSAVPYLPEGVHVGVVDPGVGTQRRAIAVLTARGDYLVGPDNGLLLPAAARLGGILRVHELENPVYRLSPVSMTFHGRDVFAPAAAHLATRTPIESLGPPVDPRGLAVLDWPEPEVRVGQLRSTAVYLDTFGNVKLSALAADLHAALPALRLGERLTIRIGSGPRVREVAADWVDTFGRVPRGGALICEDSYGRLCLAVNQGSAGEALGIVPDAEIVVARPQAPSPPPPPGGAMLRRDQGAAAGGGAGAAPSVVPRAGPAPGQPAGGPGAPTGGPAAATGGPAGRTGGRGSSASD